MTRLSRSTRRKIAAFVGAVARSMVDGRISPTEAATLLLTGGAALDAIRDDLSHPTDEADDDEGDPS